MVEPHCFRWSYIITCLRYGYYNLYVSVSCVCIHLTVVSFFKDNGILSLYMLNYIIVLLKLEAHQKVFNIVPFLLVYLSQLPFHVDEFA